MSESLGGTHEHAPDLTYALAASPNFAQDGVCFAARRSGLYRSEDGGLTWHGAYVSLNLAAPLATLCVALSPAADSTGPAVFAGVGGGVLRSLDGGTSWLIESLPSPPPVVSALVVSPNYAADGTVLAATVEDGVFRSGHRGTQWESWNFGLLDLDVYSLAISPAFAGDETLYVGTETGVFRSTNGGRAWREVGFDTDLAPVLSLALSPDYARDGCLYAGTASKGLYRSGDRGHSWERVGSDVLRGDINAILLSPEYPAVPHLLAMQPDSLLVSRDGGLAWEPWREGLDLGPGATSVAAPLGLAPGVPLLVGLLDGRVLRV